MTWDEFFRLSASMITSIGGAGLIIVALSSWLGKIWAERIFIEHRIKLRKEIEEVKKNHVTEIETYKAELEKARGDYHRFSNKKFEIIDQTWSAMLEIVDELKIYNKGDNDEEYKDFLIDLLGVITKYSKIIKKNSLFFDDNIRNLLNDYVSASLAAISGISEKVKNVSKSTEGWKKEWNNIFLEGQKKAMERENILNKIRIEFQRELGKN